MDFLTSGKTYNPVLLEIMRVNTAEGKGTCVDVYVGFSSHKSIYARLASGTNSSQGYPEYIKVRKSMTVDEDIYHHIDEEGRSAKVRTLECPEELDISIDKRVSGIEEDTMAMGIINQLWKFPIPQQAIPAVI